ncbi:hypothetical protein [Variovorax gossypii]
MILLAGGQDHRIIDAAKAEWVFEMHPTCGPAVLDRHGAVADRQPGSRSPFWRAVTLWAMQGRRVDTDGRCIWDEPPPIRVAHVAGRQHVVLPETPEAIAAGSGLYPMDLRRIEVLVSPQQRSSQH